MWLRVHNREGTPAAALLEIASLKADRRSQIEDAYIQMFKRLRGYLREAIAEGQIRTREATATTRAIIGAVDWVFYWLDQVEPASVAETGDVAWQILLQGLRSEGSPYTPEPIDPPTLLEKPGQGFDREEQNRQKQEAFYKAGTWFFNKKGFNGASLDEIAEHLNVSKGAFYYHIKNKEDLLYACYERSLAITRGIHQKVSGNAGNGLQKIDETARRIFFAQNSEAGPLIRYNTITALPPVRRRVILDETERNNSQFDAFFQQGIRDGTIRDVNPFLARSLLTGAINAAMDISLWRRVDDLNEVAVDYFDIFINGLLPR